MLDDMRLDYYHYVIQAEEPPPTMDVETLLDVYESFHMLSRATSWGPPVPLSCTCLDDYKNCVCCHGTLLASLWDDKLRVPDDYVAAEPSSRKKARMIKGTAGPWRARLLSEIAAEKGKTESKIRFMDMAKTYVEGDCDSDEEMSIPKSMRKKSEQVKNAKAADKMSKSVSKVLLLFSPLNFASFLSATGLGEEDTSRKAAPRPTIGARVPLLAR